MPRPRMPPTPLSSTELVGRDKAGSREMECDFSLPPAALHASTKRNTSRVHDQVLQIAQTSPPPSPYETPVGSALRRKRTLSGSAKLKEERQPSTMSVQNTDNNLPPPPSRARKIIQMKPKQSNATTSEQQDQLTSRPTSSHKENATPAASSSKRKQGQSSTTSAAGRKIARKTAHSIIERRRRSKMNEEFGVLKDMIPACAGAEMHKLAILQAGIEYVRYLEGCVEQLKAQNDASHLGHPPPRTNEVDQDEDDDDDEDDEDEDESMDLDHVERHEQSSLAVASAVASEAENSSPSLIAPSRTYHGRPHSSFRKSSIVTNTTNSTHASPDLRPIQSSSSLWMPSPYRAPLTHTLYPASATNTTNSVSPPPVAAQAQLKSQTGMSPAINAFHLSPDLTRTSTWSVRGSQPGQHRPSPNILPLPQAAMPMPLPSLSQLYGTDRNYATKNISEAGEGHAEATATAALLMMTKDRRESSNIQRSSSSKRMSVKELLSS